MITTLHSNELNTNISLKEHVLSKGMQYTNFSLAGTCTWPRLNVREIHSLGNLKWPKSDNILLKMVYFAIWNSCLSKYLVNISSQYYYVFCFILQQNYLLPFYQSFPESCTNPRTTEQRIA